MVEETLNKTLFLPEIFRPDAMSYESISTQIEEIDKLCFPLTYTKRLGLLNQWFNNPNNTAITLNRSGFIEGFTLARPVPEIFPDRGTESDVANATLTAIRPELQHKGLVQILMNSLDKELLRRGFKYVERNAKAESGWNYTLAKAYEGRIVEKGEPRQTEFGLQQYFKIRL